ncbi:MAG: glycosyltransferase family 39 protein [Anaerolineae bacterium]|nr:glycosyltransferase family 39 protein [Anaerolineae bacterium]NUQ02379.1 glycosyltransferase family 39 protein [Anaerolineae bacterium]
MTLNRWRSLLVVAYCLLGVLYSIVTPIFEASDELWHYPLVKTLADNSLVLPVQAAGVETAWRQEGSQPPLYYMLAAVLTGGIDTSDMNEIRRINPHADIGVIHPDGNVNMIVHPLDAEGFPWKGTVLAVHMTRFLSVLFGAATIWVTFAIARSLFPHRPEIIVGAAAMNTFLPMFLFISGSVNNDNLSTLLGNLVTLQIVFLLRSKHPPSRRAFAALGISMGAGMLAKFNIGFHIPVVMLCLLLLSWRYRSLTPLFVGGVTAGGLTVLIAGWWYLRNTQLYGDPTGLNVFLDIVGRRAIPANLSQLWAERHSFLQAFWGLFGGMNIPLPSWVYSIFDMLGAVGVVGSVGFVFSRLTRKRPSREHLWQALPYALTLLWMAVSFVSYLRWTSETPASQGRLMFGALSSILIWLAVGITTWLPSRLRVAGMAAVTLWFAGVAVYAPFAIIQPAYALPSNEPPPSVMPITAFHYPATPGTIELHEARVITDEARPGDYVFVELIWSIAAEFPQDWSLFVHVVSPDGLIIAQRDIYPGAGAMALSDLTTGRTWRDMLAVQISANAYAPQTAGVVLGWYQKTTGQRMEQVARLSDDRRGLPNTFQIGEIDVIPRESALGVPNPTSINFGGLIELVGYAMSDFSPNAGDSLTLTLYWRALQPVAEDYIVFAHVIDPAQVMIYAGSDAQPANWTRPTSTWTVGEIVEDSHILTLSRDTPPVPGIYEVEIGFYQNPGDGSFPRLRVITADGDMANDFIYLSRLRVLPREDSP